MLLNGSRHVLLMNPAPFQHMNQTSSDPFASQNQQHILLSRELRSAQARFVESSNRPNMSEHSLLINLSCHQKEHCTLETHCLCVCVFFQQGILSARALPLHTCLGDFVLSIAVPLCTSAHFMAWRAGTLHRVGWLLHLRLINEGLSTIEKLRLADWTSWDSITTVFCNKQCSYGSRRSMHIRCKLILIWNVMT